MSLTIHNLTQGSPEWLAYRAQHFNASDAPAMMGCSPYKTRSQLLHELHTGLTPGVDAGTQRRFDDGHRFEALARPLAEQIIGETLYPVVGSEGKLSASFDGLTMMEDTAFEHKTLNDELRACMTDEGNGYGLPLQYQVQMEQQLMVSGAERVLFMASKWAGEELIEERHCWYASDPGLRARIVAGWAQFEQDLAAHRPEEAAAPAAVGHTPESLPALRIEVTGMVTASNLDAYKAHALAVFGGINRELQTDQQFADAEKVVKWCGDVEARLAAAKQHALSQTESIDALFRAIDDISAEAKRTRLELDKLVKARKEAVRGEIVAGGVAALREHVAGLNARLGQPYMPAVSADFAGAIKGRRSIDSIQDAVDTLLANAKIEASATADRIQANMATLQEVAFGFKFLFADVDQVVLKAPDDCRALAENRVAAHKAQEAERLQAEQARIRAEELARIEREQQAAAQASAAQPAIEIAAEPEAPMTFLDVALADEAADAAPAAAPAPNVVTMPTRAAALLPSPLESAEKPGNFEISKFGNFSDSLPVDTGAVVTLGQIVACIGPGITVSADFVRALGFEPLERDKKRPAAVLYRECDVARIGAAIAQRIALACSNFKMPQAA